MKDQKAFIGKDSLKSLGDELKNIRPQRILIFHGHKSYAECGAEESIGNIIRNASASEVCGFSDFSVNPEYNDLQNALGICSDFNPDLIIAVGGGSAIDMAKLVRFFYSYDDGIEDGLYEKKSTLIPLIAVPTTAGTGAEATHFAVLYKDKTKYSVEHDDVLPDLAVVYPPFTYKNPPYLTACTGFDALAQGIEAFWNKNATKESDTYAKRAIELIYSNLPLAVNSPTEEVRDKMAEGSYWAGRAINITKTTAPHAFSYPFTSFYGYPHGHAVALTFAIIAEFNIRALTQKKGKWLHDIINSNGLNVSAVLSKYISGLGLNLVEKDYNPNLILSNINTLRLSNNPVKISNNEAAEIIEKTIHTSLFYIKDIEALKLIQQATIPIFHCDNPQWEYGNLEAIGTGVLINMFERRYLITASHVLENYIRGKKITPYSDLEEIYDEENARLSLSNVGLLLNREFITFGEIRFTTPFNGNVEFAICLIDDEFSRLSENDKVPITEHSIGMKHNPDYEGRYLIHGYPSCWVEECKDSIYITNPLDFVTHLECPIDVTPKFNPNYNLMVYYDKSVFVRDDFDNGYFSPKGISGCGLWYVENGEPKLVGIMTDDLHEMDNKPYMLATKIDEAIISLEESHGIICDGNNA